MEELNTTQIILTAKLLEVTEQIVRLQNRAQELKNEIKEAGEQTDE